MCTNTYLSAHIELGSVIGAAPPSTGLPTKEEFEGMIQKAFAETQSGGLFHWPAVTVLAQK